MEIVVGIAALVVAVIAAGIAIWQGLLSRKQLKLAEATEQRTERTLDEIRRETAETRRLAEGIKTSIDERINRILDSKLAGEEQSRQTGAQVSQMLIEQLMQSAVKRQQPPTQGQAPGEAPSST